MTQENFKQAVKETVPFFHFRDRYDEKYIIRGVLEIIKQKEEYISFAEHFQYLPPEMVFFFKISFGEKGGQTKECLAFAEKRYKLEIQGDRISRDLLIESISKACIISLQENKPFRLVFAEEIIRKTVNTGLLMVKKGMKRPSINVKLHQVLNSLDYCGVLPEDLFLRQVTT